MTDSLLDNELIRKYFGLQNCEHAQQNNACCSGCFAKAVLAAMQQPIRKGEYILQIMPNGEIHDKNAFMDHAELHLDLLRLPDAHQKQKCQFCATYKIHSCENQPTPSPEKLQSCKGHYDQVFCNDPKCGRRDEKGFHYATGDPRNKFVPTEEPEKRPGVMDYEAMQDALANIRKPKDAAVEEKINKLSKWFQTKMTSSYHWELAEILRDLVRLVREHK